MKKDGRPDLLTRKNEHDSLIRDTNQFEKKLKDFQSLVKTQGVIADEKVTKKYILNQVKKSNLGLEYFKKHNSIHANTPECFHELHRERRSCDPRSSVASDPDLCEQSFNSLFMSKGRKDTEIGIFHVRQVLFFHRARAFEET
jgi:hypothetical protein